MERRKLTKEDIDKVRDIEGFPIGSDEDIIALSDAPYYTACPNPFIEDFIKEYGKPYDEATDYYHREPFAADVSEGKSDAVYMAHTYHTKVPHKAIMKYILHYTNPNDIVFDGFCGTGMTALAAELCEYTDVLFGDENIRYGIRNAIISDLSPVATFIAHNYTNDINSNEFIENCLEIIKKCKEKYNWMYMTKSKEGEISRINYVIWSDIFICPNCGEELVFWDVAIDDMYKVNNPFLCSKCGSKLKKSGCSRVTEKVIDRNGNLITQAKQVPVVINYVYNGKKYEKKVEREDLNLLLKIKEEYQKYDIPDDILPEGDNTSQPIKSHNYSRVNQFYFERSAIIFAYIFKLAKESKYFHSIIFLITSILTKTGSKLHNVGFKNGNINLAGAMPNVLYVPSTVAERNVMDLLESKIKDISKVYTVRKSKKHVLIQTCSATQTNIPSNAIDYIFTDPPFGANINYSEMNFLWESWLKVKTNIKQEAIMNHSQHKELRDYQELMTTSFREYYRILKPGRWMTVEFHNSLNAVWNAIQESLQKAGFIIADVRTLDKKQGTFKQMTSVSAVKQDLVISAYKPKDSFKREIINQAGNESTAWAFVRQHLSNIPVAVVKNGKLEIISERQSFLLFDRMVAYHIMQGLPVPIDATDFYKGLDEKFLKRDGMYFLPDQVNEYDTARLKADVEPIQFNMFVTNEKSAIAWLYQILDERQDGPQTYADLQPKFMQEMKTVDKNEKMPELQTILEENFLQDEKGRWYVPDVTKEGDLAKLREKNLWREFESYMNSTGKLKLFRSEAIRVGFSRLWKEKNYAAIVSIAERLPEKTVQEDQNLLMYYDISLSRI